MSEYRVRRSRDWFKGSPELSKRKRDELRRSAPRVTSNTGRSGNRKKRVMCRGWEQLGAALVTGDPRDIWLTWWNGPEGWYFNTPHYSVWGPWAKEWRKLLSEALLQALVRQSATISMDLTRVTEMALLPSNSLNFFAFMSRCLVFELCPKCLTLSRSPLLSILKSVGSSLVPQSSSIKWVVPKFSWQALDRAHSSASVDKSLMFFGSSCNTITNSFSTCRDIHFWIS